MALKSNEEFVRNLGVGVVGNRKVKELLEQGGFQIIALDRSCLSGKLWAKTLKKRRLPDLLCIKSGTRIESRAKSDLQIVMSDSDAEGRAWDQGLRDEDLAAFITCTAAAEGGCRAGTRVWLFRIGDMRAASAGAKRSGRKAVSQGSEVYITWPSLLPGANGTVEAVTAETITLRYDSGRSRSVPLVKDTDRGRVRLSPYAKAGDRFENGQTILASVIERTVSPTLDPATPQYHFLPDLRSGDRESAYAAAKALGYLPAIKAESVALLTAVMTSHQDSFVRLEAAASLARLAEEVGWVALSTALRTSEDVQVQMEAALILGEIKDERALRLLGEVARDRSNDAELRCACLWGTTDGGQPLESSVAAALLDDPEDVVALHAVVVTASMVSTLNVGRLLDSLGDNARLSAAAVEAVVLSSCNVVEEVLRRLAGGLQGPWRVSRCFRGRCCAPLARRCSGKSGGFRPVGRGAPARVPSPPARLEASDRTGRSHRSTCTPSRAPTALDKTILPLHHISLQTLSFVTLSHHQEGMAVQFYQTPRGRAFLARAETLLPSLQESSIDLVLTSPPFPLLRQKVYGNLDQREYVNWLVGFGPLVRRVLKDTGSFVLDLGGAYQRGVPVRSLYNFRVLLRLCDECGFHLAQEFFWHNPSKLPSPIEWVNKRKVRVKDSVNTVWWLGKTEHPKANVSNVLVPYSERMKKLIEDPEKFYQPKERPSGHDISGGFGKDNGGAIPPNLLQYPNTESNSLYIRTCKAMGVDPHPARFPRAVPEFFIKLLTDPGDVVMDLFAGSNTTGEVAEELGRNWVAVECEREYVVSSAFRFMADWTEEDIGSFVRQARGPLLNPLKVSPKQSEMFP